MVHTRIWLAGLALAIGAAANPIPQDEELAPADSVRVDNITPAEPVPVEEAPPAEESGLANDRPRTLPDGSVVLPNGTVVVEAICKSDARDPKSWKATGAADYLDL
jgi:hypothetical protein